jgi:hypothetical protein
VLITAHALQSRTLCWVNQVLWHTVLADEAHDYLRGQHANTNVTSLTLQRWAELQHRTISISLITSTPFVTNISYDFVAMTKAVAQKSIRESWGMNYTDLGLEALVKSWISHGNKSYEKNREAQDERRKKIAEVLSTFMIRRDQKSKIHGVPVMTDYFKLCRVLESPLIPKDSSEIEERERIFSQRFPASSGKLDARKNGWMLCLSYSTRFQEWEAKNGNPQIWDGYTLEEGHGVLRTGALIAYLEKGLRTGNRVVVFAQRKFLMELALKVIS